MTRNAHLYVGRRRVTDIPSGSVVLALENDGLPIRVVERMDDPESSYPYFLVEPTLHDDDSLMWKMPPDENEFFTLHICPLDVVLGEPRYMSVTSDAMQVRRPWTAAPGTNCVRATLTRDGFRVIELPSGEYAVAAVNGKDASIVVRVHGTPVHDEVFSSDAYFFIEAVGGDALPPLVDGKYVYELVLCASGQTID